ncbi:MAG TPA: redoxin domain-containing protein [Candidatus Limnocylindrales bacterium]|nr:redoxin domain-containing protein [Candidatus Limnocylindrales bacterium]
MPAEVGKKAPELALEDQSGTVLRLKDYVGRPVVLYFYPKDDTLFEHPAELFRSRPGPRRA